ncbi:MAG: heme o synthase [Bacteroidota bacterium]|nr:heme o synthase [Bacteroidota bacterium]
MIGFIQKNKRSAMIKVINNFKEKIKILAALGKAKITLFVSLSSALGFILTGTKISIDLLFVSLGVFILSSGCSALNQWQEMLQDSIMNRTKNRPIP